MGMKEPLGVQHGIRTWLEIDKSAIQSNLEEFRKNVGENVEIAGVVKSNAYGHGLVDFSKELVNSGIDWLAVDSIVEGIRLREKGFELPILILGYTLPGSIGRAEEYRLSVTISSFENFHIVRDLHKEGKSLPKIHLKFNTGMNRQGFSPHEVKRLIDELAFFDDKSFIEGVYTHMGAADDPAFDKETKEQLDKFEKVVASIKNIDANPIIHAANAPATLNHPSSHFDMVRVGIGLYGIYPSRETKKNAPISLRPVLSWKTIVSEVNAVREGEGVGYGFTERLERDTQIAVCPIGYWHGFPRNLSGKGEVLICGKRARVLGRVSMDMIVVDITDIRDAKVGDEVVLLGRQADDEISAEEIAETLDTISYEIVTRINPLIKKFYI
jgi:alanine racemase